MKLTWSKRGLKTLAVLQPTHRRTVEAHLARLREDPKHARMYRLKQEGSKGAFALKCTRRVRVVLDESPDGWEIREVVDRADKRYYRTTG